MFINNANAGDITIQPLAIESYSKEFNVSSQEAERRLKIESQLPYIVEKLNNDFGDSIASVYFDNGQDFKLVVRTTKKGNTQKQVINLADKLSKDYSLSIEVVANSPRNFKAIQNIVENQRERIAKEYSSFQMIGYQPLNDAIKVAFYEPDVAKQNEIKAKLQKISGMDTVIEFIPAPIKNTSEASGGGTMVYSDSTMRCSGGFTGTLNGVLGILTATHCVINNNSDISYYKNTNVPDKLYSVVKSGVKIPDSIFHEIAFVPLANTTLSGSVQKTISYNYGGSNTPNIPITGIGYSGGPQVINGQNVAGTYVCHTGMRTGYSCGNVVTVGSIWGSGLCNTAILHNSNAPTTCRATYLQVSGSYFKIDGGDSGGPLFDSSGLAYGIASAMYSSNSGIFSSLAYLQDYNVNFVFKNGE